MDPAMAKIVLGKDLDEEQISWGIERCVTEAPSLMQEKVDLTPFRDGPPRTWIRGMQDIIVPPPRSSRASPATSATARCSTSTPATCA